MHSQLDKENIIKNSKLEMSIKPFIVTRQDLGKSKTQQKNRKGISRVNSLNKNQPQHHQSRSQYTHYSHGPISTIPNFPPQILIPSMDYSSQHINSHTSKQMIKPLVLQPIASKNIFIQTKEEGWYQQLQPESKTGNNMEVYPNKSGYNFSPIEQQNMKRQMELLNKIEELQKQLIIIQRENEGCLRQKKQWVKKCEQLCQANQNLFKKIGELNQELNLKNSCQQDKQQVIRRKQKYIEELLEQKKTQGQKLNQSYNKINQLNVELQKLTTKIIQLQNKQTKLFHHEGNSSFAHNPYQRSPFSYQQISKELQTKKQQIYTLREENRQLLIKNSSLTQQKNKWQSKLNITLYQIQSSEQKGRVLRQQYEQLKTYMEELEKQAMLGRALKKQAGQTQKTKLQLKQIKELNQEYEIKIRQLQQRRLNQIQFHHEEVKRIQLLQATKYEKMIEIYQEEKNQVMEQLKSAKDSIHLSSYNHNETIQSLNKQYENLVMELKYQLEKQMAKYNQLEYKFISMKDDQQKQVSHLLHTLKQSKEDNSFLINRLNEEKEKNVSILQNLSALEQKLSEKQRQVERERQRVKQKERQKQKQKQIQKQILRIRQKQRQHSPSKTNKLQQFQNQLKCLQSRNVQMSGKLHQYQLQATKLSDKIHILQIEAQKSKNRQQTYERKIKHLQEQLEHLQTNKNKSIDQKIKIVEELQNLRMELKTKQAESKIHQKKLQENQQKIHLLQKKQIIGQQLQQKNHELQQKNNLLTSQVNNLANELDKTKKQIHFLAQQSVTHQTQDKKLVQKKQQQYQKQIDKYKQCIELLKQELAISKQKLRLTQEISHQLQYTGSFTERNKQNRIVMFKNIFMYLNPQKYSITVDANTWKLSEQQIISLLTKVVRLTGQEKSEIEVKYNKMQAQNKDLIQIQNTTRILAQKYHDKTLQLQNLLIKMEQAHNKKILMVKQDYDVVYNKYLKYRNMVIAQNKEKEKERESKDKYFKK